MIVPLRKFRTAWQCLAIGWALALLTLTGAALRVNLATISLLDLLLVLAVAFLYGFWQASITSLLAVVCIDLFFLPPLYRLNISDPQDWVSLATFEVTALAVSRLSARELRNASEAAIHRKGMEQLYELSRNSLLLDLRQALGPQLVLLIQRIFGASAVALFDSNLKRTDRIGDWIAGEEELAKECYVTDAPHDEPRTHTARRVLRASHGSVGALAVRGELGSLVLDAVASLAAIAMERHQSLENEDRAEKASQSETLRTAVLDALAHELKTPLTAIQAASGGLIELGGLGKTQSDLVHLIEREGVRLNDLCTRLLRTAKLEAKEIGLQISDVNVRDLVLDVLAVQGFDEVRSRVEVEVEDTSLSLRGDRGLLATILTQYVDNARKYSNSGTKIKIAAEESRTEVLISVHNMGAAIRVEDRERIFERFYRSPASKDSVAGTGIGLSIARKAAEAHHGHVWVVSSEGAGTTFFVSLPNGLRRSTG